VSPLLRFSVLLLSKLLPGQLSERGDVGRSTCVWSSAFSASGCFDRGEEILAGHVRHAPTSPAASISSSSPSLRRGSHRCQERVRAPAAQAAWRGLDAGDAGTAADGIDAEAGLAVAPRRLYQRPARSARAVRSVRWPAATPAGRWRRSTGLPDDFVPLTDTAAGLPDDCHALPRTSPSAHPLLTPARMGERDVTFRRLLREVPEAVLRLAFPGRRLRVLGPATDASVDRPRQLTTDKLFRIRDGKRTRLLHVEVEHKWRPTLPRRLFDYASAAHSLTGLPVVTVVLLLERGGRPPRSPARYRVPGIGGDGFVFSYHVVPLAACEAAVMKRTLPPEAWAFLVAMRGGRSPETIRALATEIVRHPELPPDRRQGALRLLALVTAAIIGVDVARSIFLMESIINSPGVQELFRQLGEEAREQGLEQGREQGRLEEARAVLLRVLTRRGFTPSEGVIARVAGETDLALLEAWLDAAVTATSLDEVFAC
jgi:hypothetical protein